MNNTFFAVRLGAPARETLEKYYGVFDETAFKPEEVEEKRAAYERKLKTGPLSDPRIGTIVALGYLRPDGASEVREAEPGDRESEKAILQEFWQTYDEGRGSMAGWNVHAVDLHFLKVRSWLNQVPIPVRAMRPAGNRRTAWIGFTDVRAEFRGRPETGNFDQLARVLGVVKEDAPGDDGLTKVARFFGMPGQQASIAQFNESYFSDDPSDRAKAIEDLKHDLLQAAAIAVRIGLEMNPSGPVRALASPPAAVDYKDSPKPPGWDSFRASNWDIETAPGELENLKRIMGGFDPANVKVGNLKDPGKIAAKISTARDNYDGDLLKQSMLDPMLGRICAIQIKHADGTVEIPRMSEPELLRWFWSCYEQSKGTYNGWNIFGFDVEWVIIRSWFHGIAPPAMARSRAGNGYSRFNRLVDLMIEFTGNSRDFASIDSAARALGFPGKTGHGEDFYKLWESKNPEDRQKAFIYGQRDVDMSDWVGSSFGFSGIQEELPIGRGEIDQMMQHAANSLAPSRAEADFDMVV